MVTRQEGEIIAGIYEVRRVLGEGTLGPAYQVLEKNLNQLAVLKYLPAHLAQNRDQAIRFVQFYRERRKQKRSGFAPVLDIQVEEGIPLVVFPFLEGVSLATLVEAKSHANQQFSWEEGSEILEGIARILAPVHPYVHGNLKPRNVFLKVEGVTLTDDGFLSFLPPQEFVRLQSRLPLSSGFMAPELFTDPRETVALDIYSFGALAYFLFTGTEPSHPLEPLEKLRPDLPKPFTLLLSQLLADEPGQRPASFAALLCEWGKLLSRPDLVDEFQTLLERQKPQAPRKVEPTPPPPPGEPRKPWRETQDLFDEEALAEAAQYQPAPSPPTVQPQPPSPQEPKGKKLPWLGIGLSALLLATAGGVILYLQFRSASSSPPPRESTLPAPQLELNKVVRESLQHLEELRNQLKDGYSSTATFAEAVTLLERARTLFLKNERVAEALRMAQEAEKLFLKLPGTLPPPKPAPREELRAEKEASTTQKPFKKTTPSEKTPAPSCPERMVLIPEGTYRIGSKSSDPLRDPLLDQEERKVTLSPFCIDLYEYPNQSGVSPRNGVSFSEAESLCKKEGKRLCSEEEWEAACRGSKALIFPYGNEWDADQCNTETREGKDRTLAKSGSFRNCRSPFGVSDLSGNLMEWTSTPFEKDPRRIVAKGGSYLRPNYAARCSYRYPAPQDLKDPEFGFRCCTDVK